LRLDAIAHQVLFASNSIDEEAGTSRKEKPLRPFSPEHFGVVVLSRVAKYRAFSPEQNAKRQHHPKFDSVVSRENDEIGAPSEEILDDCRYQTAKRHVIVGAPKQEAKWIIMIPKIHGSERAALALSLRDLNDGNVNSPAFAERMEP
jgi:hypothetical protein